MQTTKDGQARESSIDRRGKSNESGSGVVRSRYPTKLSRVPAHWDPSRLAWEFARLEQLIHHWSMKDELGADARQLLVEFKRLFPRTLRTDGENKLRTEIYWDEAGWQDCRNEFASILSQAYSRREGWGTCIQQFGAVLVQRYLLTSNDESEVDRPEDVDQLSADAHGPEPSPTEERKDDGLSEKTDETHPLTRAGLIAALMGQNVSHCDSDHRRLQYAVLLRDVRRRNERIHARRPTHSSLSPEPCTVSDTDSYSRSRRSCALRMVTLVLPERLHRMIGL